MQTSCSPNLWKMRNLKPNHVTRKWGVSRLFKYLPSHARLCLQGEIKLKLAKVFILYHQQFRALNCEENTAPLFRSERHFFRPFRNPFRKRASAPNLPHCQNNTRGPFAEKREVIYNSFYDLFASHFSRPLLIIDYRVKLCSEDFSYKKLRIEYKNSLQCGPAGKATINHLIDLFG